MLEFDDPNAGLREAGRLLEIGGRFPNFSLNDSHGGHYEMQRHQIGPLLAVFADSEGPGITDLADALSPIAPVDIVIITPETFANCPYRFLIDKERRVRRFWEETGSFPAMGDFAILLDETQRIAGYGPVADPVWLRESVTRVLHDRERIVPGPAPILQVPRVFEPEFCQHLIRSWHEEGHEEGMVSAIVRGQPSQLLAADLKKRLDLAIERPGRLYDLICDRIVRRLAPEIYRCFSHERFKTESFYVVCYDSERQDFFAAHRDNTTPATLKRRFAITINLNDDFDDGGLVFPEYGRHAYKPPAGGAVIFSCSLMHEATRVSRGKRFAFLGFLVDPE